MKKYYLQSVFSSLAYLIIVIVMTGFIVVCFFEDEMHSGVIFSMIFLSISVVVVLIWVGYSLTMRIQIDYEKKELYIKNPLCIKRFKFEDVLSIKIIDYNEVAFDFVIETEKKTMKFAYARYYKKKPTEKILTIIKELKQDLMNITDKNY